MKKIIFIIVLLSSLFFEPVRYFLMGLIIHLDQICLLFLLINVSLWLYTKNIKRPYWTAVSLFFVSMVNFSPIPRLLLHDLENMITLPKRMPENIEGIIILGGSFMLNEIPGEHVIYNPAGTRLFEWLPLLKKYPKAKIVFTGSPLEAFLSKSILQSIGVPHEQLIIEDQSKNTADNAKNTTFIDRKKTWILVTSAFHMPRALKLFQKKHSNILPYSVNYFTNSIPIGKRLFSFYDGLNGLAWRVSIKEMAGMLYASFR